MLSQKQLEIKYLSFLINAGLSGQVLQEADPEGKRSMQEASGLLLESALQGGGGGRGAGLGKRRSWSVASAQQRPQRTYRGAAGLAWGKEMEPVCRQSQPVMG